MKINWQQSNYWTTAQGKKILLCRLSDSHLINILLFLEKRMGKELFQKFLGLPTWTEAWNAYGQFDPDTMASYYNDMWVEMQKTQPPLFAALIEEVKRRHLGMPSQLQRRY